MTWHHVFIFAAGLFCGSLFGILVAGLCQMARNPE